MDWHRIAAVLCLLPNDCLYAVYHNASGKAMTQKHDIQAAFEKWMKQAGYVEGLNSIARQAWQAALSTILPEIVREMEALRSPSDNTNAVYRDEAIAIVKKYLPEGE